MNEILEAKAPFSGNGLVKGISFIDIGYALIGLGQAVIMTSTGDRATFTFQEIGHCGTDGKTTATGAAFFTTNSSAGKLTFLNE